MQDNEKKPALRFKGFTDPWEQRKLGELSRSFEYGLNAAAKEYDGQNKYLRITDIDDTSRQFVSADITSPDANLAEADNYRLSDGDVLFARTGASVGKTYLYKKSDGLVYFAGFLIRAKIKESVSAGFIFQNTLTRSYERYIAITSQRSGQPGVNAQEYAEYQLMLPELFEQEKIAKLLEALDILITLHQRKYEKLVNIKKSMLDKMFPKNGASVPEIRFKGFTDLWEQRKLGEVFEEYSEKNHAELPPLTIIQGGGTIRRDESERALQYDKSSLSNYKMVNKDDFIVHLRSFEGGLEKASSQGIISPAYHTFHGEDVDSRFYYAYFRSKNFINKDLKPHVYGIRDGRSIDIEGMKTIRIPWASYPEQKSIGDFLTHLDTLITLHQRKLEKLQNIKKSCLEKMFV